MAAGSIAAPVSSLLTSGFDDVQLDGITLDISSSETKYAGTLERITLDRTEVRRGEKVEVQAYVRTESGKQFVQEFRFRFRKMRRWVSCWCLSVTVVRLQEGRRRRLLCRRI